MKARILGTFEKNEPTMKIALFSDIHSNLPALEAFFETVQAHAPDATYCLGDLVGYNIWPNEVIRAIRQRSIPCIAGNYDFGIGRNSPNCGCAYKTEQEQAYGDVSIAYTNENLEPEERRYLRTLPAHIRLDFQLGQQDFGQQLNDWSILLVHGSPRRINEYLFEDRAEGSMLRIMRDSAADVLCFGHTHKPYHRILEDERDGKPHYRHAINIGSVGKPKDGDPRGCFALITLNETSSLHDPEGLKVEFVRFEYDVEKAARAVEESPLPDYYAEALRKAK